MIIPQIGETYDEDMRGFVRVMKPYVVDTFNELVVCGIGDFPSWMRIVNRRAAPYKNSPHKRLVQVFAEGMSPEVSDNQFEPNESNVIYEFDVLLEENPVETHPKIEDLIKQYGGRRSDDGSARVTFDAPFLTGGENTGDPFGGSNTPTGKKNPMYGLTSYLTLGSIFRKSYVTRRVNSQIFDMVGTIRNSLPYGLPTPENHSWVVLPPRVMRRGECMTVDEEQRLIRDDSGVKIVYELMRSA